MEMEKENTPIAAQTSEGISTVSLSERLQQISAIGHRLAIEHQHQTDELLTILRTLEELHRHIREDFFQHALPRDRHSLYSLLLEIEEHGGWPYIERMRLQALLRDMQDIQEEPPAS
jgi:hypothetical protein